MSYDKQRYATDPEYRELSRQRCRKWYRKQSADPEWVERKKAKAREIYRKWAADPEWMERRRARQNKNLRERYAADPEYREKKLEYFRFREACKRTSGEPLPESAELELIQAFEYEEFDHVR